MTVLKLLTFINIFALSIGFINFPQLKLDIPVLKAACNNCGERTIYRNYLLGLRKTRKLLTTPNFTNTDVANNVNALAHIINFTSEFVSNYTSSSNETIAKHIIMGNIVLDVSNIKEIHIKTEKDVLIVELDKKKEDTIVPNMNNIETIINSLSLVTKILNI